ncbi:hypothetical protein D3C71_2148470 [compost metagenome]
MALDDDEFIEVYEATLEETQRYISEGRIADAKTILAVYYWQLHLATKNQA